MHGGAAFRYKAAAGGPPGQSQQEGLPGGLPAAVYTAASIPIGADIGVADGAGEDGRERAPLMSRRPQSATGFVVDESAYRPLYLVGLLSVRAV